MKITKNNEVNFVFVRIIHQEKLKQEKKKLMRLCNSPAILVETQMLTVSLFVMKCTVSVRLKVQARTGIP